MARLIMMLAPPRSFSSLVSTMIGQHPEIYGFPELHLLVRETVRGVMTWERDREKWLGPPGLLRSLAELKYGGQTAENVLEAANWVEDRQHWASTDMMQAVMELAQEKTGRPFCLEKTPTLAFLPGALDLIRETWPDALYVHVTRHPLNLKTSMDEFVMNIRRIDQEEREARLEHTITAWPVAQRNILDFCATLKPGQYIRIRGEDVLSDAYTVMEQVAEWAGLRTDREAIDAMLRPEDSPYANLGPPLAAYGNDPKFIYSPKFRPGKPRLKSIEEYLKSGEHKSMSADRKDYLVQLANCLGYE